MAEKIINVKHRQRHDTEANWTSKNPVLLDGEMGFVTGTQKYKVGDGTSKWSTLAYHTSLTDSEKTKLDGIAAGANKTTVDSALSSTSTNPVQNKVINNALSGKANTNHTHNYAGSSSAGGAATSANKLTTARTVSGGTDIILNYSYDGSANSSANIGYYSCKVSNGNTNNYPFHRFAKLDKITESYMDKTMTVYITQDYNNGGFGIVRLSLRTNGNSLTSAAEVKWLVRSGFSEDAIQIGIYNVHGNTYADAFLKTNDRWNTCTIRAIASGRRGVITRTWELIDSAEVDNTTTTDAKTSTESYITIADAATALHKQAYSVINAAYDNAIVANATKVNYHTVNSDVPSGAKFTDTVYTHPITSGNKHIPSGGSSGQILRWSADGTAVWGADNNTTYADMKGATTSADGTHGLVPAPANGAANRYLRSDGTWQVPPDNNTTYSNMTAATASAAGKAGLVPAPAAGKQGQFLRGDGTWATPNDTNTWRGIQNNLTSTATDQSLSAYQGKLLNEKITNRILFQSSEPTTQSENDVWIKTTSL